MYHGDVATGPTSGPDGLTLVILFFRCLHIQSRLLCVLCAILMCTVFLEQLSDVEKFQVIKDEKMRVVAEGFGQCSWPDGTHYEGEWHMGLPHGEGTMVFNNGETYMGEWEKGVRQGFGRWCSGEGHEYCGYWKQGLFHGHGHLQLQGGGGYWGPYQHGQMHGTGFLVWPDGFVMAGQFENGMRHGNALEMLNADWITVRADAIYDRDRLISRQPADTVKNGAVILDTEGRRAGRLVGGRTVIFEEVKRARNRGLRAQLHDGGVYVGQVRKKKGRNAHEPSTYSLDGRGHVTYWQGNADKIDALRSYEGLFCNDQRHGIGIGRWDEPPHETIYAGAWQEQSSTVASSYYYMCLIVLDITQVLGKRANQAGLASCYGPTELNTKANFSTVSPTDLAS